MRYCENDCPNQTELGEEILYYHESTEKLRRSNRLNNYTRYAMFFVMFLMVLQIAGEF